MRAMLWIKTFMILLMPFLTLTPRVTGAAWTSEAIDAPKLFSTFYSRAIAIDDSGDPHIAYGEDHLYYAYHDGSSWNYETVDSSARVGQYASIAIDSSTGDVHICYYDWGNGYLKYATNATGSWVAETVDSSADVGVTTSIAVESTGDVHISYYDADNFELKYATGTSGSWSIETVDTGGGSGDVGLYSSIALDSSGNAHISYYDYKNDDLKYATNATGPWVPEQLDGSGAGDVGLYTSLAIDTLSNIHISYYDWGNGDLKYITGTAGSWGSPVSIETVSSGSEFDRPYTSITTDSLNKAHISYYDEINSDLKYATDSGVTPGAGNCGGTNWDCETVQSVGNAGLYPSIARDSSNNIHISYFYGNQGTLRHATNSGVTPGGGNCNDLGQPSPPPSNWDCETVDFSNDAGSYTSIAKDVSGKIHISYYDEVGISGVLKYITNASGSWVETVVESIGNAGKFSSIAIDSSGKAHISYYYDSNFRDLYYATNDITPGTGNCGGTDWECERVDGSGSDVGTYTSIAMDSSDTIHISYYDAGNEALKYATGTSGSWSIKTVDSSANVGILTSIALDSSTPDNKAHIAYYDLDGGNLKYATNNVAPGTGNCTDTDWNCETVDTGGGSGDVGYDNSIVIDSLNNAHISYYDFDSDNLKYATGTFGSWSIETVDTGGGEFTSIARDSSDTIHISYHDATNGDLKYATNNVTPGSGNCTNTDWDCESVDSTSTDTDLLHHTSIVMVSGNAHISYYDADLGDLKYTTNATFYTLTVSKTGAGDGTVTSSPGGIDCGTDCSHDYIGGIDVTLTPTPDASSAFTGWSGDPDCSDGVVTMNAGKSCTAAFEPAVTLTVTKAGTGSGTVTSSPAGIDCGTDCSEDYTSTTVVTLTPAPDTGSAFAGWSGDPDCSDGVVTMDPAGTDKTCTATFNLQTFTLSVNKAGTCSPEPVTSSPPGIDCGADCSEDYSYGTEVTLTATSRADCTFDSWTDCDSPSGNTCTMTMDANKTVTANFTAQYLLTTYISPAGAGNVSPDCSAGCWYETGTIVVLTATANTGYEFDYWTGCDSASNNVCTMTMDTDENVTANFLTCPDPVLNFDTSVYYTSLQQAYDEAGDGHTIKSQTRVFTEDLYIDDPVDKSVTLIGGYDCNYNEPPTGKTTLNGTMTISDGILTINDGTFEIQ